MYFFPKSYQKFDEKFDEEVSASNALVRYYHDHWSKKRLWDMRFLSPEEKFFYHVVCDGVMYSVAADDYVNMPFEFVELHGRIMRKYKYEITKTPTAQIYEAFCIELDPQYRNIVEKVKIGYPLTEEEQAMYDDIHYQA